MKVRRSIKRCYFVRLFAVFKHSPSHWCQRDTISFQQFRALLQLRFEFTLRLKLFLNATSFLLVFIVLQLLEGTFQFYEFSVLHLRIVLCAGLFCWICQNDWSLFSSNRPSRTRHCKVRNPSASRCLSPTQQTSFLLALPWVFALFRSKSEPGFSTSTWISSAA